MISIKEIILGDENFPLALNCECEELRFLEYSFDSKLYKCKNCGKIHETKIAKKQTEL